MVRKCDSRARCETLRVRDWQSGAPHRSFPNPREVKMPDKPEGPSLVNVSRTRATAGRIVRSVTSRPVGIPSGCSSMVGRSIARAGSSALVVIVEGHTMPADIVTP